MNEHRIFRKEEDQKLFEKSLEDARQGRFVELKGSEMGWWTQNSQGHSFARNEDGTELVWGDGPADFMDNAIDQIVGEFERAYARRPTKDEMRAGLEFSLGGSEEVGR